MSTLPYPTCPGPGDIHTGGDDLGPLYYVRGFDPNKAYDYIFLCAACAEEEKVQLGAVVTWPPPEPLI